MTLPLEPNIRRSPKLQLLDTGLVNFASGLQETVFTTENLSDAYKGLIAEHITAQELLSINSSVQYKLNYWMREETGTMAEVDLVVLYKGLIIPIEVKAGSTGKLRSLHQFIDRAPHHYAVRVFSGPFSISKEKTIKGKEYRLLNMPFYLVNKLGEYLEVLMNK